MPLLAVLPARENHASCSHTVQYLLSSLLLLPNRGYKSRALQKRELLFLHGDVFLNEGLEVGLGVGDLDWGHNNRCMMLYVRHMMYFLIYVFARKD